MDETKIKAAEDDFARSLDSLTVEEVADRATLAFFAMSALARKLAAENAVLRGNRVAA